MPWEICYRCARGCTIHLARLEPMSIPVAISEPVVIFLLVHVCQVRIVLCFSRFLVHVCQVGIGFAFSGLLLVGQVWIWLDFVRFLLSLCEIWIGFGVAIFLLLLRTLAVRSGLEVAPVRGTLHIRTGADRHSSFTHVSQIWI